MLSASPAALRASTADVLADVLALVGGGAPAAAPAPRQEPPRQPSDAELSAAIEAHLDAQAELLSVSVKEVRLALEARFGGVSLLERRPLISEQVKRLVLEVARPETSPPHSGGGEEQGEDSGAEAEFLGGGSRATPPRRPSGAPVEELAEHTAAYDPHRGAAASEARSSSATASRYSSAGSQGSVGNSRRRARGGLPWAPQLPQPQQQQPPQQQQEEPFPDFDETNDASEALSQSSRGPLRPIAYDVHTRPGGIYAHETHSRSFSDPRGSLFWKVQGLWDRRTTLLATGERLAKDVWLLVRADPWARRAAIAFACSVGAGTLGVAWLIALVIVQAVLLALSSVVGLMLLVSSFLVPIALLGLTMIGSAAGFFLAGNIGLHVMENREALAARVQELRRPSQQSGGRSSELRVAKDDIAAGFPYRPDPDSAASLD